MAHTSTQLRFVSALSDASLTADALRQIEALLRPQLAGPVDLAVVFATPEHADQFELIQRCLTDLCDPAHTLGCTAEGVIGVRREVQRRAGLTVLLGTLPGAELLPFSYLKLDWPALLSAPEQLASSLNPDEADLRGMIMLADPFSTPTVRLLPALGDALPGVPVCGGMASAFREPGKNRLLIDGEVLREGAVGLTIAGDVRVDCTVSQGCLPVGRPLVITKARRHVVQELGGRPAVRVVADLLHELEPAQRQLVERNGLLVGRVLNEYQDRFGRGDFLIRNVLTIDHDAGYLAINDPQVRVGQTVQFHVHDRHTALDDLRLLLDGQRLHGPASGALLFSCSGRGDRLFGQPHQDANLVADALGQAPLAGFFAGGEIGPIQGQNYLHSHTACLMAFRSVSAEAE